MTRRAARLRAPAVLLLSLFAMRCVADRRATLARLRPPCAAASRCSDRAGACAASREPEAGGSARRAEVWRAPPDRIAIRIAFLDAACGQSPTSRRAQPRRASSGRSSPPARSGSRRPPRSPRPPRCAPTSASPARRGGLESADLGALDLDGATLDVWAAVAPSSPPPPPTTRDAEARRDRAPGPAGDAPPPTATAPLGDAPVSAGSSAERATPPPPPPTGETSDATRAATAPREEWAPDPAPTPQRGSADVPGVAPSPAASTESPELLAPQASRAASSPTSAPVSSATLRRLRPSVLVLVRTVDPSPAFESGTVTHAPLHDYEESLLEADVVARSLDEQIGEDLAIGGRRMARA